MSVVPKLDYQLVLSKRRKTLLLQVKYGQVTVRAPHYVTPAYIEKFIQEKSSWLRAKLAQQQQDAKHCNFTQGAKLLFLGKELNLNITSAKHAKVFISDGDLAQSASLTYRSRENQQVNVVISERINVKLIDSTSKARQVKKQLEVFFKQQAEIIFNERLAKLSKKTSLTPSKITIKKYKSRWGSCNNRGEVSLNYLLMMTPLLVIDYVIVHELSHLEFLDHSKSFWTLVEKHLPEYKIAKQWLSDYQQQLQWYI